MSVTKMPVSSRTPIGGRVRAIVGAALVGLLLLASAACGSTEEKSGSGSDSSGLPSKIAKSGVITVGTDASYPPYEFLDPETHELRGFEVDLMNAIAERMGLTTRWEFTQFAGLIPGVASGRYDVAIEAMADSLERQQQVSFVNYGYGLPGVLHRASDDGVTDDPLSICGKSVAIQQGTNFLDSAEALSKNCVDAGKPKVALKTFSAASDALLALSSGRVDGNMTSYATGAYQVQQQKDLAITTYKDVFEPKIWGIAVAKDDAGLQKAVLEGLKKTIADGEYERILAEWHVEDVAIKEPGINLADK